MKFPSIVITALPVPGDVFDGNSLEPVRLA
jgi:hypothetical protein